MESLSTEACESKNPGSREPLRDTANSDVCVLDMCVLYIHTFHHSNYSLWCGKAELRLVVGFLLFLAESFQNFTGISPRPGGVQAASPWPIAGNMNPLALTLAAAQGLGFRV